MKEADLQEKQLKDALRPLLKSRGYKMRETEFFKMKDGMFIKCYFCVMKPGELQYSIRIKHSEHDDIFWKVMEVEENRNAPMSLRACGVWVSPTLLLERERIDMTCGYVELAERMMDDTDRISQEFMDSNDIDEYIVSHEPDGSEIILKCEAYIHMGRMDEAVKMAKDIIDRKECQFYTGGERGFFDRVYAMRDDGWT